MNVEGGQAHIVLKFAKVLRDPSSSAQTEKEQMAEKPTPVLIVPHQDLVQLLARDVRLNPEDLQSDDFETDASIGRGRGSG
jgi:hypothetical protein